MMRTARQDAGTQLLSEQRAGDRYRPSFNHFQQWFLAAAEQPESRWLDCTETFCQAAVGIGYGVKKNGKADDERDALDKVGDDVGEQAAVNRINNDYRRRYGDRDFDLE